MTVNYEQDLLPIGSVVRIKEWKQKLMIYGRLQNDTESQGTWDYVACYYPHGNLTEDSNVFFNHEDIKDVIFKGFEDHEEVAFRKILAEAIKEAE
ncbi:hypothetical protein TCA2_4213 [Paenibacillus sp. TCA20]|uniref:DUF4176 domain-containing protein n=1 Tax=Paenibacillus sp. TCA20 TaxID=1499968 RepID=UPI0004D57C3D|nr:DUF4176 domain-containing protein [Paenibacillus sp. TCA20]GAK41721.1 hypothetical protein TCA2_4213 [Paenibacillus sp. TCA20]